MTQFHESSSGPGSSSSSSPQLNAAFAKEAADRPRGSPRVRGAAECCYSISNLALIVATIVALTVLVRFIQDDPLYDYGEYLLTLRFYRYIIYMTVVMPLVLLVPIFNAASAFFTSAHKSRPAPGKSILVAKILYLALMLILVFIALIFVAPSIAPSGLAGQIELEVRKHMQNRYENTFSYNFLERLQEEYECCDELWYRTNMHDYLPTSCFVPGSNFGQVYDRTCSDAVGWLVGTRCSVLAVCFLIILVSLAALVAIDVLEMLTIPTREYDVGSRECQFSSDNKRAATDLRRASSRDSYRHHRYDDAEDDDGHGNNNDGYNRKLVENNQLISSEFISRLKLEEREREQPLLPESHEQQVAPGQRSISRQYSRFGQAQELDQDRDEDGEREAQSSPILTRASYRLVERRRSQSPAFVQAAEASTARPSPSQTDLDFRSASPSMNTSNVTRAPPKSVLKKSPSFQRMDSSGAEDADSLDEYAERLRSNSLHRQQQQREQQLKRSLLNVRFADRA